MIKALALVFVGGGLGSVLRYSVGRAAATLLGPAFPWGTLTVNAVGGLAAGIIFGWIVSRGAEGGSAQLLLITGLLGGFTTFSAFSLDAVLMWQRGQQLAATAYVAASVLLAIAGVVIGLWVSKGVMTSL